MEFDVLVRSEAAEFGHLVAALMAPAGIPVTPKCENRIMRHPTSESGS